MPQGVLRATSEIDVLSQTTQNIFELTTQIFHKRQKNLTTQMMIES